MRAIDGDELLGIERLLDTDVVRQSKTASWLLDQVLHDIQAMPTLTQQNEPLTLEQLREMDGEPVWFDTIKRWGIVKVNREGIFVVTKSGEYEFGRCKVYRRPPEEKKNASPDLISRSALLRGETEPEIITGSDSELAEHMEWERWMDKIKRAPAVGKEEEP